MIIIGYPGIGKSTLAGKETDHYIEEDTGDVYYRMMCTDTTYQAFKELVEEKYPNLCDFDVEVEVEV